MSDNKKEIAPIQDAPNLCWVVNLICWNKYMPPPPPRAIILQGVDQMVSIKLGQYMPTVAWEFCVA